MPTQTENPLFKRMRGDGLFGMAPKGQFEGEHPFAPTGWAPPSAVANPMMAGMPEQGQAKPPTALNVATGNIFGGGIPAGERAAATSATVPQQVAGVLGGMEDQGRVTQFNNAVKSAGFNLDPTGQLPEDYQGALAGAKKIYDNVFGAGMPGGDKNGGPIHAYAPTGLRERTLAAGGQGVWGQGDVMAFSDGQNAQGGQKFSLGQVMPVGGPQGGPVTPQNPIAPEQGLSRLPQSAQPSAYQQNSTDFKNHIVSQQNQAGLLKGLPPGYMLDPEKPNAIKPIPGGPAEAKLNDAAETEKEGARQTLEKANTVTRTINKILPQLDSMTTGVAAALTKAIPGTPAYNVNKLKDTVTANIGLKELKSMRDASKSGASGMGQLSEKELDVLQSSLGNLDLAQDTKQVAQAMKDVRNSFYKWRATYKAGQMGETPQALQRQNAVRWAIAHEKDPRAEQIFSMDDN